MSSLSREVIIIISLTLILSLAFSFPNPFLKVAVDISDVLSINVILALLTFNVVNHSLLDLVLNEFHV